MSNELEFLKKENKRLKAILSRHGIDYNDITDSASINKKPCSSDIIIPGRDKIDIFKKLFKGRPDVFAIRCPPSAIVFLPLPFLIAASCVLPAVFAVILTTYGRKNLALDLAVHDSRLTIHGY